MLNTACTLLLLWLCVVQAGFDAAEKYQLPLAGGFWHLTEWPLMTNAASGTGHWCDIASEAILVQHA